jgi:hypothetical protein
MVYFGGCGDPQCSYKEELRRLEEKIQRWRTIVSTAVDHVQSSKNHTGRQHLAAETLKHLLMEMHA